MKISEESARHLDTAILLMEGVKESLSAEPDKWGCIPPEHSRESIHRRCVQARQELLQVCQTGKGTDTEVFRCESTTEEYQKNKFAKEKVISVVQLRRTRTWKVQQKKW